MKKEKAKWDKHISLGLRIKRKRFQAHSTKRTNWNWTGSKKNKNKNKNTKRKQVSVYSIKITQVCWNFCFRYCLNEILESQPHWIPNQLDYKRFHLLLAFIETTVDLCLVFLHSSVLAYLCCYLSDYTRGSGKEILFVSRWSPTTNDRPKWKKRI